MGIRIFLPAVYRLSEQTFDQTNGTILQRLYPAGWLSRFMPILTNVIWLIVAIMLLYFIFTAKTADKAKHKDFKIHIFVVSILGVLCLLISIGQRSSWNSLSSNSILNGQFQIGQTSFTVIPNNVSSYGSVLDYYTKTEGKEMAKTTDYDVCVRLYNNEHSDEYVTYSLGLTMNKGKIESYPATRGCEDLKLVGTGRDTADKLVRVINLYANYIKKHHLEDDFNDYAKLMYSDQTANNKKDKVIIMKGKNGKILSLDGNQVNLTVETDTHYEIL